MSPHTPQVRRARLALALLPTLLPALVPVLLAGGPGEPPRSGGAAPATAPAALPPASRSMPSTASSAVPRGQPRAARVLVISLDALNPAVLRRLGREDAPQLWRLLDEGTSTLNARTAVERTETLPNHTGMLTGLRIGPGGGGHSVTWNDERPEPSTVHQAAGRRVESMFTVVHDDGGSTALFSTKTKFSLFERSWPAAIDRTTILPARDTALVREARTDLVERRRDLTFVHLGAADVAGHQQGFMSAGYLQAVRRLDRLVGRLVAPVRHRRSLRGTVVVLTADHGGDGAGHSDPRLRANYRIPFVVWGRGVGQRPLYGGNPAFVNPGADQVAYDTDAEPVRNGDVANLALDLLGLPPVPGSTLNATQGLHVG